MKKNILFLLLLLVPFFLLAQIEMLHFDSEVYDFREIKEEGGKVSCVFRFTNKGKSPVIIYSVKTSCGCTTPEWTRNPILSGKEGHIKVIYDPANRPGIFSKTITVRTSLGTKRLFIKGTVIPVTESLARLYPRRMQQLRLVTSYLMFGVIGNKQQATIAVVNDSQGSIKVSFPKVPTYMTVEIDKKELAPKEKGSITISYDANKVPSLGFNKNIVPVLVNGVKTATNNLVITATVVEDFSNMSKQRLQNAPIFEVDNPEYQFVNVASGVSVQAHFKIKNTGKTPLVLRKIETSSKSVTVKIKKRVIPPNMQVQLDAIFDTTGKKGYQNQTITLITNVPNSPVANLRIMGIVK